MSDADEGLSGDGRSALRLHIEQQPIHDISHAVYITNASEVEISQDALRMRLRRLCEKKTSGRYMIDQKVAKLYQDPAEREIMEMALLDCIAKHGVDRSAYKRIKVGSYIT